MKLQDDRLNVFEINNDVRRERYVSVSPLPLEAIIADHERSRPARIAHWDRPTPKHYRVVEADLPPDEAFEFANRYAEVMRQGGWITLLDLPAR